MDLSETTQLSPGFLEQLHNNWDKLVQKCQDDVMLENFLANFPFGKLLDVGIMDAKSLRICVQLLNFLLDTKPFSRHLDVVRHTTNFILVNLSMCRVNCAEVNLLLELMRKLFLCLATTDSLEAFLDYHHERLVDMILKLTNIEHFDELTAKYCARIMTTIFRMHKNVPALNEQVVFQLFENYKQFNATLELCLISKFALNEFFDNMNMLENITAWLIEETPAILFESKNDKIIIEILHCWNMFCYKITTIKKKKRTIKFKNIYERYNRFLSNLMPISNKICVFLSHPQMNEQCVNLLAIVLAEFCRRENIPIQRSWNVAAEIQHLPSNVMDWPFYLGNTLFFCICYMIVLYSESLWDHEIILKCMANYFYQRQPLNVMALKAIYFLYPVLIKDNYNNLKIAWLGEHLLEFWSRNYTNPTLYTMNIEQLKWVLRTGCKRSKITILRQWINTDQEEEVIVAAIKTSNAGDVLFELLMKEYDSNIGMKITKLIRKTNDRRISISIALQLHKYLYQRHIFNCLMLCGPGVPIQSNLSLLLCSFMGAAMSIIDNEEVLREACYFSRKLLTSLRKNPKCVKNFCREITNISNLFYNIDKSNEETSIEIIRLLETVLIIQNDTKADLDVICVDFAPLLVKGTTRTIRKSLELLYYVLNSAKPVISIESKSLLSVYVEIFENLHRTDTAAMGCNCLTLLMLTEPWLAMTPMTATHIEILCMTSSCTTYVPNFVKLLQIWLKILIRQKYNGFCAIPKTAIKSFIMTTKPVDVDFNHLLTVFFCNNVILD